MQIEICNTCNQKTECIREGKKKKNDWICIDCYVKKYPNDPNVKVRKTEINITLK